MRTMTQTEVIKWEPHATGTGGRKHFWVARDKDGWKLWTIEWHKKRQGWQLVDRYGKTVSYHWTMNEAMSAAEAQSPLK